MRCAEMNNTQDILNAIRYWCHPSHNELSGMLATLAAKIKENGSLSEKCKASIIDQLDEMADEIDQDLINQKEESKS